MTNRRNGMLGGPFSWDPFGRRNLVGEASYSVGTSTYDGAALESPSHVVEEKVGVLLLNLWMEQQGLWCCLYIANFLYPQLGQASVFSSTCSGKMLICLAFLFPL